MATHKIQKRFAMVILFLGVVVSAMNVPTFVDAAPLDDALLGPNSETHTLLNSFEPGGYSSIAQPGQVVYNVIAIVLGFLGLASVIMIIYGGFLWVTAGGEEDKAKKGTTILFQAVIGALIVMAAYTVTYFVLVQLSQSIINVP